MSDRTGIFAGDDPYALVRAWMDEAKATEPNDYNAIALATTDATGMPNARMVLLKEVRDDGFVFYTNYGSAKGRELEQNAKAAFVMHWKTLRRQVRVRGEVEVENGPEADAYYASRSLKSRLGAWASRQSHPLSSRGALVARAAQMAARHGPNPGRPPFWGGYVIRPVEIEFWADGAHRLHDRFKWISTANKGDWSIERLNP